MNPEYIGPDMTLLLIDGIGVIVGLVSIAFLVTKARMIGGEVKKGILSFIVGISFMALAFAVTILHDLGVIQTSVHVLHHLLMMVGMILFVVSAKRFAMLAKF